MEEEKKYVYLAWWDNGLTYDDNSIDLVGVFATEQGAKDAGTKFDKKMKAYASYYNDGHPFVECHEVQS